MSFSNVFNIIFNSIYKPMVNSVFPPVCFLCDSLLSDNRKIVCTPCWSKLKLLSNNDLHQLKKVLIKSNINNIFVLYDFTEVFQNIIHLLKYERCLTLGKYLSNELLSNYTHLFFEKYKHIIPVPLHPIKFRERGYNQSFEIIKHLAGNVSNNLIIRKKQTLSQTKLNRAERINNVAKAFYCSKNIVMGKVLLFDDIITTGSTLNECAGELKRCGASVDVLALAAPLKHAII